MCLEKSITTAVFTLCPGMPVPPPRARIGAPMPPGCGYGLEYIVDLSRQYHADRYHPVVAGIGSPNAAVAGPEAHFAPDAAAQLRFKRRYFHGQFPAGARLKAVFQAGRRAFAVDFDNLRKPHGIGTRGHRIYLGEQLGLRLSQLKSRGQRKRTLLGL
jgi:hypothetical protein